MASLVSRASTHSTVVLSTLSDELGFPSRLSPPNISEATITAKGQKIHSLGLLVWLRSMMAGLTELVSPVSVSC